MKEEEKITYTAYEWKLPFRFLNFFWLFIPIAMFSILNKQIFLLGISLIGLSILVFISACQKLKAGKVDFIENINFGTDKHHTIDLNKNSTKFYWILIFMLVFSIILILIGLHCILT
jgi:hypothetical protein